MASAPGTARILSDVVKKTRPNQATAFFYKASQSLSNNGVIGCVLPTSIFYSEIYSDLRNKIGEELNFKVLAKRIQLSVLPA